jgi:hypothetical protein
LWLGALKVSGLEKYLSISPATAQCTSFLLQGGEKLDACATSRLEAIMIHDAP